MLGGRVSLVFYGEILLVLRQSGNGNLWSAGV
jgi:hypothetical protein